MKLLTLLFCISFSLINLNVQAQDIFTAARNGDLKQIQEFYKKDSNSINIVNAQNYTPLVLACYHNRVDVVKYLIEVKVQLSDSAGTATSLQAACYKGYEEIADALLAYGANPNHYDANGTSPLIYATQFKHFTIIKLLLKYGADKEYKDLSGFTAMDYAEKLKIEKAILLLK